MFFSMSLIKVKNLRGLNFDTSVIYIFRYISTNKKLVVPRSIGIFEKPG